MNEQLAELFDKVLATVEQRLAEAVARAEPPLGEVELRKAALVFGSIAQSRATILGKTELAN